jgi:hypothetical protein
MNKDGTIDFSKLEKQLLVAVEEDARYQRENDAKFRAVAQKVGSYEEFKDIVAASHLKPLDKKDTEGILVATIAVQFLIGIENCQLMVFGNNAPPPPPPPPPPDMLEQPASHTLTILQIFRFAQSKTAMESLCKQIK